MTSRHHQPRPPPPPLVPEAATYITKQRPLVTTSAATNFHPTAVPTYSSTSLKQSPGDSARADGSLGIIKNDIVLPGVSVSSSTTNASGAALPTTNLYPQY